MNMDEFSILLGKLDHLGQRFDKLSSSVAACQALACEATRRRRGWLTWLSGAATTAGAVLLGWYLRR
jgi:hypothetical protein